MFCNDTEICRIYFQIKMSAKPVYRCLKCQAVNSLAFIVSRAHDGNYLTYANGDESEGYLPHVDGLCDSDGLMIKICILCGQLAGLDLVALKEQLQQQKIE